MASPLQIIKDQHGSKEALIDKLLPLIERPEDESEAEHKARLMHVANSKLLHLLAVGEKVKERGGREALVTRVLELKKQPKDHEYRDALMKLSLGRLLDLVTGLEKHAKA